MMVVRSCSLYLDLPHGMFGHRYPVYRLQKEITPPLPPLGARAYRGTVFKPIQTTIPGLLLPVAIIRQAGEGEGTDLEMKREKGVVREEAVAAGGGDEVSRQRRIVIWEDIVQQRRRPVHHLLHVAADAVQRQIISHLHRGHGSS